jgi:hypothetical protein
MSYPSTRAGAPRFLVLALASLLALAVAGAASAEFPTKRSDPSVKGTPQEGETLNGQTGQWLFDNGLGCPSTECKYTYQWQRCNADRSGCVDVPGRTGFTYLLGPEDVGKTIRLVEYIFKRDCGAHNTQTGAIECKDITKNGVSFPIGPIAPKPVTTAQNTAAPTVQGLAMEDEVLRATPGTWTGPGTITKVIYWQRCNLAGEGCATISGAIGPTYRLTTADVRSRIRVVETATNEGGTAQAVSNVTAAVVELRPTATRQTISVTKLSLPHRLVLNQVVTRQSGGTVTLLVKVSDDRGFRVGGVQVWVTPTGLLSGSGAPRISNANGWAKFTFRATGSGRTFVYVEARRKGEEAQSGISSANLFRIFVR